MFGTWHESDSDSDSYLDMDNIEKPFHGSVQHSSDGKRRIFTNYTSKKKISNDVVILNFSVKSKTYYST